MEKKKMAMWTMIVVLGVLLAACLSANGATWEAMDCPTTESLRGVWGSAADNVFAVGTSGTILHYDVTGQWKPMNSPTSIQLNSIWGSSADDIWAVGDSGTILRCQDGNDWQEISNIPSDLALNGVWGAGADDIYAVGQYTYGPGCILHWNGTSWTNEHGPIVGPLGSSMQFNAVWGRGPNEVYVVGHNGYSSGLEGVCYKYDGTGWSWEWSNTGWPKTRSFYSVWGLANELFIAAEGYGGPSDWFAVTVHYNGTEWATKIFQDSLALMGVWGSAQDNVYMCSYSGMILHYDGVTWSNMDSGTTELLRGVWGNGSGNVFAVGDHGTILHLTEPAVEMGWVTISEAGFAGQMSKYETTNAQYCQFLNEALASGDITVSGNDAIGANGSNSGTDYVGELYYDGDGPGFTHDGATNGGEARINYSGSVFSVDSGFEDHPVTFVSWYGATAFCGYYGYRLPTEDEWQAVADYDGSFIYGCGTSINNNIANYEGSTHPDGTTVVGAFGSYGYGMADMAGNIQEWVSSTYSGVYRVLRGGTWYTDAQRCAISFRNFTYPYQPGPETGFRVVRDAEPVCIVSEDFDIDPGWFSTEPTNVKWDPSGFYRARVTDNPGGFVQWGYSPVFQEVSDSSFTVEFDMNPADPSWGTYPLLALIAEGVANPYINDSLSIWAARAGGFPNNFIMQGKPYGSSSPIYFSSPVFAVGEWYHQRVDYDAASNTLTWKISLVGMPDGSFYSIAYTNISVAPFNQVVVGYEGTPPVYGSWAEIYCDNILVCVPELPEPNIAVSPLSHDFGDVELGTSSTVIVTISNEGNGSLNVSGIALETDFAITAAPAAAIVVELSQTVDVEITYTPTVLGDNSAVLKITSDDPDEPMVEVQLSAAGVEIPPPPSEQIANILAFFDTSVNDGSLVGDGQGSSAEKRLNALRNMVEAAGDLIEDELSEKACQQLLDVYNRMDGQPKPPDFVTAEAVPELATMVQDLMTTLGCE